MTTTSSSQVPIGSFESIFISTFPRMNRPELTPGLEHLRRQLSKSDPSSLSPLSIDSSVHRAGSEGWSMKQLLTDFHLLLFLSHFMDMTQDIPRLCESLTDLDRGLDEGYEILIRSLAEMGT